MLFRSGKLSFGTVGHATSFHLLAESVALETGVGRPLLSWQSLRLQLQEVQPLARQVHLASLDWRGARWTLVRDAQGRGPLGDSASPAKPASPANPPADASPGPDWSVRIHRVDDGEALFVKIEMPFDERQNAPTNGAKAN